MENTDIITPPFDSIPTTNKNILRSTQALLSITQTDHRRLEEENNLLRKMVAALVVEGGGKVKISHKTLTTTNREATISTVSDAGDGSTTIKITPSRV